MEFSFDKLSQDGVVFALSGFVNPERGNLRTQATNMGAIYRPDWGPDCTLLVCAFANTPKFKQVQSNNGTIISKACKLSLICVNNFGNSILYPSETKKLCIPLRK
jgi:twin BRCT domain